AVRYWYQAGERDLRRFAMKESVAHYSNAERLVATLPATPERAATELTICLELGQVKQITIGPASKEAAAHYERALALARTLGRGRESFLATWGLWFHNTILGDAAQAFALADELLALARDLNDSDLLVEAYHARMPGLMRVGDVAGMKEAAEQVVRLYDRERHRDHAYYFGGHDARVCALSFLAQSQLALGFSDQAERSAWRCIEDAPALRHTYSVAHSLIMSSLTFFLLNDVEACRAVAEELQPIAERNKFAWPLTHMRFMRSWLTVQQGDVDVGVEQMRKAAD